MRKGEKREMEGKKLIKYTLVSEIFCLLLPQNCPTTREGAWDIHCLSFRIEGIL